MKRFLILLSILFCTTVFADTINLYWYVDDDTYATTTCEIGGGVTLPTEPTKHGYDFIGWSEMFNRGTFGTWAAIPNGASGYMSDSNGSNVPQENDYIIVNDASGVPEYGENIEIQVSTSGYASQWNNYCRIYIGEVYYGCVTNTNNGEFISYYYSDGNYSYACRSDTKYIVYNGTKYTPGNRFLGIIIRAQNNGTYYAKFINGYPYSGKWLLRYHGNWSDWGRGGWVAEKSLD